jgi:hypothetical protein
MDGQTRKALASLVRAARAWAPTRLTRTDSELKGRLELASHHLEALGSEAVLEELERPAPPAFVALHGKAIEDVLAGARAVLEDPSLCYAVEVMVDHEGLKVRINGGPTWSPGFGEPRGSQ